MCDVQVQKVAKLDSTRSADTIPSRLQWVNVKTTTNSESAEFYEKFLGWSPQTGNKFDAQWMEVKGPQERGVNVSLSPAESATTPVKVGDISLTVVVKDLAKFHEVVKDIKGVKVVKEPTRECWGGFKADYLSPDGTGISVLEEWEFDTKPKGSEAVTEKAVENEVKDEKAVKEVTKNGNGICFLELPCEDEERASKFYTETFGWTFKKHDDMDSLFFDANDEKCNMAGKLTVSKERLQGLLYIACRGMDGVLEKVKANGGTVEKEWNALPPNPHCNHYTAFFKDTEGNSWGTYYWEAKSKRKTCDA
jgi:hypothetical protein